MGRTGPEIRLLSILPPLALFFFLPPVIALDDEPAVIDGLLFLSV